MSQHADQNDKPFPCSLVDGHINPCWALNEVLQSYGGRGTRSQGIEMQTMLNMTSMEFSRNLVIAKSGKHGKKGLVLNFCPYCRGELVEDAEKNLATALSKAEGHIGQELALDPERPGGIRPMNKPAPELIAHIADQKRRYTTVVLSHEQADELLRLANQSGNERAGVESHAAWQQSRGVAWDIIDQAISEYDEWMLDDDYDAVWKLHIIMGQMRARKALYRDEPDAALAAPPAQPAPAGIPDWKQDQAETSRLPRPSEAPSTHGKPDGAVRECVDALLEICDGSNWPEEAQSGVGFKLYQELTEQLHDIALTLMSAALHSPMIAAAETSPGDVLDVCPSCFGSGRHEGRFGHNDPECTNCNGVGKVAIDRLDVKAEAKSAEADEEKELFAAVTKIDLAGAVKHLRNWAAYKANEHCQEYANLIEAQARLIAWFVKERAVKAEAKSQEPDAVGTPAARWREEGKPDPHGNRFNGERSALCGGSMTDDEIANAVYLDPSIMNLTAAKERIRWLSRKLCSTHPTTKPEAQAVSVDEIKAALTFYANEWLGSVGEGGKIDYEPTQQLIDDHGDKADRAIAALIAGGR